VSDGEETLTGLTISEAARRIRNGDLSPVDLTMAVLECIGRTEPLIHAYVSLCGPARRAVKTGFGVSPVDVPLLGGSLPGAVFTQTLGLPSFLVPHANADERNHAPNENISLDRFFAGIRTAAALFAYLAESDQTRAEPTI